METDSFHNGNENLSLVLGGARSGKSRFAEGLARATGRPLVYIATCAVEAGDGEMAARIALHRAGRGADWTTVEEPLELARAIAAADGASVVLVDCLTLWLSNLMFAGRAPGAETDRLIAALEARAGPTVLVSNELGMGLVPESALGRRFRDAQGQLNQRLASRAGRTAFVVAGLPLWLRGHG